MDNFSDFNKKENIDYKCKNNSCFKEKETKNIYSQDELESMISKYSSMSKDGLLSEFIRLTIEKKKRGELRDSELDGIKKTILPMLDAEQKKALENILEMVKNVK